MFPDTGADPFETRFLGVGLSVTFPIDKPSDESAMTRPARGIAGTRVAKVQGAQRGDFPIAGLVRLAWACVRGYGAPNATEPSTGSKARTRERVARDSWPYAGMGAPETSTGTRPTSPHARARQTHHRDGAWGASLTLMGNRRYPPAITPDDVATRNAGGWLR